MQITINQKVAAIFGGTVVVIAAIAGGAVTYNNHKAAEAKKAAELAYANRPIVEQSCTMNGWGEVECDFTNSGKTAGALCGYITVEGHGTVNSDRFCSGMVQPMSTERVETTIPKVEKLCSDGYRDWRDVCDFGFIPS